MAQGALGQVRARRVFPASMHQGVVSVVQRRSAMDLVMFAWKTLIAEQWIDGLEIDGVRPEHGP